MSYTIPTDVEQLIAIANQIGFDYDDAYEVWRHYAHDPHAYLIVKTVLLIAKVEKVPVSIALKALQKCLDL